MMRAPELRSTLALKAYLAARHGIPLLAPWILRRRIKRGKESPSRWREKLGHRLASRPDGPLIWLNAVGLGEVLSLRGLVERLHEMRPELSFLITSTTVASAQVLASNMPPRTIHQFLPIDAPGPTRRFLDHFRPDLCIWVEQELWPGIAVQISRRGIPQAIVAARVDKASYRARRKAHALFNPIYKTMAKVTAQDETTAQHLNALGAMNITVSGSLKPAAPALDCAPEDLNALRDSLQSRRVWAVTSAHHEDEVVALAAHEELRKQDPNALLILAPRYPDRGPALAKTDGLPLWSQRELPKPEHPVWICDKFGALGLIYRLSEVALIGGTFGPVEGHNPWEAVTLGCAVMYGPRTANFHADYAALSDAGGAVSVSEAGAVFDALATRDFVQVKKRANAALAKAAKQTDALAASLIGLLDG